MKRMHIHVGVENVENSIPFYSALFGADPVKIKPDYAKWMVENPRINFAISTHIDKGVNHLGLQVDEESELEELRARLDKAQLNVFDEGETICCYAKSDKSWVEDPAGIAWEAYQTMEDAQIFSLQSKASEAACCTPETKVQPDCCVPSDKTAGCCG